MIIHLYLCHVIRTIYTHFSTATVIISMYNQTFVFESSQIHWIQVIYWNNVSFTIGVAPLSARLHHGILIPMVTQNQSSSVLHDWSHLMKAIIETDSLFWYHLCVMVNLEKPLLLAHPYSTKICFLFI